MATMKEHYENLLADYYTWMFGDPENRFNEFRGFFKKHNIASSISKNAIDLGAGPGFQSIPLAEAGFKVYSIDLNKKLLKELQDRTGNLPIETIHGDIRNFIEYCPENFGLCVCMCDTLTHLESLEEVEELFQNIYKYLESAGKLVLTFRDLSMELTGLDRFIPVQNDDDTIFTCCLEYEQTHVKVHDLIYSKENGSWNLKKSFYRKVKIPLKWAVAHLEGIGFKVETADCVRGIITIISTKYI